MRSAAIIHPTSVTQPATGAGGNRRRAQRDLVRACLRALPGPGRTDHRHRWA